MECVQNEWLSDKEYFQQFNRKVAQQRIPLTGSIDLTHRCNLRCVHCYLGNTEVINGKREKEISTQQWISIIDQITEAGCLYLLITGGEPLLRRDFGEIYRRAKMNGLIITLFSNGTMITEDILGLFQDLPPQTVEISLYGATANTYEKITGVKGSYRQCRRGIEKLLDHNINVKLKTILMTLNSHEFYDMENIASDYGVKFRFDPAIFPSFGGNKSPMRFRVDPKEVVEMEFSNKSRSKDWKDFFKRMKDVRLSDSLYNCAAGITNFHINAYGDLQPCLMVKNLKFNVLKAPFSVGWSDDISHISEKKITHSQSCNTCNKITICGYCPAFSLLETGAEDEHSEYLCALGDYRLQMIKETKKF